MIEKLELILDEAEQILKIEAYTSKICQTTLNNLFRMTAGRREEHLLKEARYAIKQGDSISIETINYVKLLELVKDPEITYIARN